MDDRGVLRVVQTVAAVVARGGVLSVEGDRLVCRLPKGKELAPEVAEEIRTHKRAILAAVAVASLQETVDYIRALSDEERGAYAAALAHDLAAFAAAEAPLAENNGGSAP
jgi:TubC N-terminal docking domain